VDASDVTAAALADELEVPAGAPYSYGSAEPVEVEEAAVEEPEADTLVEEPAGAPYS